MSKRKPHYPTCPTHRANSGWLIPVRECDYCKGYAAGVQAARDAVAGVGVRKDTSHDMRVQALAAIDALRGES